MHHGTDTKKSLEDHGDGTLKKSLFDLKKERETKTSPLTGNAVQPSWELLWPVEEGPYYIEKQVKIEIDTLLRPDPSYRDTTTTTTAWWDNSCLRSKYVFEILMMMIKNLDFE